MPPPALVEESETFQSPDREIVHSQEVKMETESGVKATPEGVMEEEVPDVKAKTAEEEEQHRKMPEHPGRDSDSEDSVKEEDTEK